MIKPLVGAGFCLAICAAAAPVAAAVQIVHPWIPAPPKGAITASGYVTVKNAGPTSETFLGGSTSVAQGMEIHAMSMAGGIMRMRRMDGGLVVAAGATVSLAPNGGHHLMFVRLKRPLKVGDQIPVTLHFSRTGDVKAVFTVEGPV